MGMDRRRFGTLGVLVLGLAGLVGAGVAAGSPDPAPPAAAADRPMENAALARPMTCPEVLDKVRAQTLEEVTAFGLEGYGHAPSRRQVADRAGVATQNFSAGKTAAGAADADDFSGTNLQEAGVDEPDIVKNDRTRGFTVTGRTLRAVRFGSAGAVSAAGSITLDIAEGGEILLAGDEVVVLAPASDGDTRVLVVDVADLDDLRLAHTIDIEGRYVSARQVDDAVRLVVSQGGPDFAFTQPMSGAPSDVEAALEQNRSTVRGTTLAEWLPLISVDDDTPVLPPCDDVYVPRSSNGPGSTSVVTIDPAAGEVLDTATVLVNATEVYATTDHLYVAAAGRSNDGREATTEIHRFDLADPTRTVYEASGTVAGELIRAPWFAQGPVGQWALSEHDGDLRVATTRTRVPAGVGDPRIANFSMETDNAVTVLRRAGDALAQIGVVEGIGRNEQLYAVRFMGDVGYVVTFRKIDPLFVIDLSDPRAPRVTGELEMPGYSAYLHPIGDGRLLGVGQRDTDVDGRADGTQVSLFDVSDPAHPRRLASLDLGDRGAVSGTESDPRSFTWWDSPRRAVLTLTNFQDGNAFRGAVAVEPSASGLREVGRVASDDPVGSCAPSTTGLRTRVIGDSLVVFSATGVRTAALDDLEPRASVAFGSAAKSVPLCTGPRVIM
jgi:uncharacterized secreted protein with C-terminal beta-propeller domain